MIEFPFLLVMGELETHSNYILFHARNLNPFMSLQMKKCSCRGPIAKDIVLRSTQSRDDNATINNMKLCPFGFDIRNAFDFLNFIHKFNLFEENRICDELMIGFDCNITFMDKA